MRPKFPHYLPALIAGTAAAFITAACGASDGGGDASSGAGSAQNPMTAYVECMKRNGVELSLPTGRPGGLPSGPSGRISARPTSWPSGRPGGPASGEPRGTRDLFGKPDGVDDAVWQRALEACRSVRPSFGVGGRGQQGDQSSGNGSVTAYQNCLKDHGVPNPAQPDATDPKVAAAQAACKILSPAPPS